MPFLRTPASYLTLAQLKADSSLDLTDRSGVALTDATLNDWLEETSGQIDGIIGQSFLPREETIEILGSGSNLLRVGRSPLLYVRQVKIVLPNAVGFDVPTQSLLVDYEAGTLLNMTPLTFQGQGITTMFPAGCPLQVTIGWGLNYSVPPPTFTALPVYGVTSPYAAGAHSIQVSSMTSAGESLPSAAQNVTLISPGGFALTVTNSPGALRYLVYVDGVCAAEIVTIALGTGQVGLTVTAAAPALTSACYTLAGALRTPASVDTSAYPLQGRYAGLRAAQKLLIQSRAWEMKNPSNKGVAVQRSGNKEARFRDNTRSTFSSQLEELLSSLHYQGVG